jgi:phage gpG-like protein
LYFQITAAVDRFGRDLTTLARSTSLGTRELLESAVREVAIPSIEANFQAGGRPPWEELAEATLERRERAGFGDRPLIASGEGMAEALDRDRWRITRTEAVYPGGGWSAGPGASIRFHQEGARDGHFPARPYVQLQPEDARALDRVGLAWVDGNLRGAGF